MSEAMGSSAAAPAGGGTSPAPSGGNSNSGSPSSAPAGGSQSGGNSGTIGGVREFGSQVGANDATNGNPQASAPADDGFEEITLGAAKGRVPKDIAKVIKDFEKSARQKMQEAAEYRKRAQGFEGLDLDGFAKQRGIDLDQIAEQRLARKYEQAQMTPEQRELQAHRERAAEQTRIEQASKSQVLSEIEQLLGKGNVPKGAENATKEQLAGYLQQQKQVFAQAEQTLNRDIAVAWKQTGLPEHPQFGVQMSLEMLKHSKRTGQTLQPAEAAARVKANFLKHVVEVISPMDAKAIHETLGKDVLQKIRDFDIERVTSKQATNVGQQNRPGNTASEKQKPMNELEYRRFMLTGKRD